MPFHARTHPQHLLLPCRHNLTVSSEFSQHVVCRQFDIGDTLCITNRRQKPIDKLFPGKRLRGETNATSKLPMLLLFQPFFTNVQYRKHLNGYYLQGGTFVSAELVTTSPPSLNLNGELY